MKPLRQKLLAAAIAALPLAVGAAPQDGKVVAGNATIRQESPTKVGITQTTDRAIIDWKSYNIGANEHVQYYQPSAASVSLNRVTGQDPSQILGRLTANGQVFLVNPNGIYFGKNAQVDVAGLVASTHNIRNDDFMAGRHTFNIPGKPGASVINEGVIRIADTGIAAFVAPSVANRGVVAAKLGKVVMAAANGFTLDFTGDNLLSFMVNDDVAQTAFDLDGNRLTSFVENSGKIEAQGGFVLLTAKAAENAVHGVINHSGVIEARTVEQKSGEIILHAGKGSLEVSGVLDASAPNGGDGGFIETSGGTVGIKDTARIATAAPFGQIGRWLIDPTDFTIAASGGNITGAQLSTYLTDNHVEIQTLTTGTDNGDIFVNDAVTWNTLNKLTLTAYRDINVNAAINANGGGSVKLRADSTGSGTGTVHFSDSGHIWANGGSVGIYYNPMSYTDTATKSDASGNPYSGSVTLSGSSALTAYMFVNDVNQLQAIDSNLLGFYALGKNIDASMTATWNDGKGFLPIASGASSVFNLVTAFSGILTGQGYRVSDLTINRPTDRGLIAVFAKNDGFIREIGLANISIVGGQTNATGGLVADNRMGIIDQAWTSGTVSSSLGWGSTGGLVGCNGWDVAYGGTISRSYSSVNVTGGGSTGGLVGSLYKGLITDSYATGSVNSRTWMTGSLVGYVGTATVRRSYATGAVLLVGGSLIGAAGNGAAASGSYWNTQTVGQDRDFNSINVYGNGATGTALTSEQMKQQATFAGWNFTNVWMIDEGVGYPTLRMNTSASPAGQTVLTPANSPVSPTQPETPPTPDTPTPQPSSLTPAQQAWLDVHPNPSVADLLVAVGKGLFVNSPGDPVWSGLYVNGRATQVQAAANSAQPTYDNYKNTPGTTLFNALIDGSLFNTAGNPVWQALIMTNLSGTNKATQLATARISTYQNASLSTLVTGLISQDLIAGNNVIWNALQSNPYRNAALFQYTKENADYAAASAKYATYANATVDQIVAALNKGDLVAGDNQTWVLLSQNPNRDKAYNQYLAGKSDPCKIAPASCGTNTQAESPKSDTGSSSGTTSGSAIPVGGDPNQFTPKQWQAVFMNTLGLESDVSDQLTKLMLEITSKNLLQGNGLSLSSTKFSMQSLYYALAGGTRNSLKDLIQNKLKDVKENGPVSAVLTIAEILIRDNLDIPENVADQSPSQVWADYALTLTMQNMEVALTGGKPVDYVIENAKVTLGQMKKAYEVSQAYSETLGTLKDGLNKTILGYAVTQNLISLAEATNPRNEARIQRLKNSAASYETQFEDSQVLSALGCGLLCQHTDEKSMLSNTLKGFSSINQAMLSGNKELAQKIYFGTLASLTRQIEQYPKFADELEGLRGVLLNMYPK